MKSRNADERCRLSQIGSDVADQPIVRKHLGIGPYPPTGTITDPAAQGRPGTIRAPRARTAGSPQEVAKGCTIVQTEPR